MKSYTSVSLKHKNYLGSDNWAFIPSLDIDQEPLAGPKHGINRYEIVLDLEFA
jgi:hypothetical protein